MIGLDSGDSWRVWRLGFFCIDEYGVTWSVGVQKSDSMELFAEEGKLMKSPM